MSKYSINFHPRKPLDLKAIRYVKLIEDLIIAYNSFQCSYPNNDSLLNPIYCRFLFKWGLEKFNL